MNLENIKVGEIAEDYGENKHEVIAISETYDAVACYDSNGAGQEMKDMMENGEMDMMTEGEDGKVRPCTDRWYFVAARSLEDNITYVFGSTETSDILGM